VNVYVVLEGDRAAKKIYSTWIPLANPTLTYAPEISDVVHNHFYVEAAFGYPGYFDRIRDAIANVATLQVHGVRQFDRLVVAIDSEDLSLAQKLAEIRAEIGPTLTAENTPIDCRLIIQHPCFESWALGNRHLARGTPDAAITAYRAIHNVHTLDPELLPALPAEGLNRSQFAYKFLRLLQTVRYHRQTYSKSDPKIVATSNYFEQVKSRFHQTGHIGSFHSFLGAFV